MLRLETDFLYVEIALLPIFLSESSGFDGTKRQTFLLNKKKENQRRENMREGKAAFVFVGFSACEDRIGL